MRAKAFVELATFIRMLDDDENIADLLRQTGSHSSGRVLKKDQLDEPLYVRDLTNKIVHAHHLEWDFAAAEAPKLVYTSRQPERWLKAEAKVVAIAAFCGQLMA